MFQNFKQVETFFYERSKVGIKPGLDRVLYLLHKLGDPHQDIKAVHVAGTNGKGSTLTYLKYALMAHDYQVGLFTSPSLNGLRGHIYNGHTPISESEFLMLLNHMYSYIVELDDMNQHPTDFEIITVLALLYFKHHVDIALIETGMGGREDTTNCIHPLVSIITNVDYDHSAFLGESLEDIARHKAGIIKNNVPVIVGDITKDAWMPIEKEAISKQACIYQLDKDFTLTHNNISGPTQRFTWVSPSNDIDVKIQMLGEHQQRNAAIAMMALMIIKDLGISLNQDKLQHGFFEATLPGRFEKVQDQPVIILDGAHNLAAVETFINTVRTHYHDVDRHLIFAAFKDKDIQSMLAKLTPHFQTITLTSFESERAARIQDLEGLIEHDHIRTHENWQELVLDISHRREDDRKHYFITGSLHFMTLVRHAIKGEHD